MATNFRLLIAALLCCAGSLNSVKAQVADSIPGKDTLLNVLPEIKEVLLQEIMVAGQHLPQVTATGKKYKLSEGAKASGDPYHALSEIPILEVDIANKTVKTQEGVTPLVLVDGKYMNSGISPIDPKFIESVEIVEVTNAKYLQMGITKIIDIRLKREVPLYTYIEGRTRNDVPLREGFGGANFEFGTRKFAVAGNLFGHYTHRDKTEYTSEQLFATNFKNQKGSITDNKLGWEGEIMLKWTPTDRDYFAATVKTRDTHQKKDGESAGSYNSPEVPNLSARQHDKIIDGGTLAAAFYEHTFSSSGTLSSYFHYNRGYYDENLKNTETIVEDGKTTTDEYRTYQTSERDQYRLSVDYDSSDRSFGNITAGNELKFTRDRDHDLASEPASHATLSQTSNYLYLSYSNTPGKWLLMASAGLEYMRIKTEQGKNSWLRPRLSGSVGYRISATQSVRCAYSMDNELPRSSYLHTFNTSTNPWVRIEGNPYLTPVIKHRVTAIYDKAFSKLNIQGYGVASINRDMIETYIHNEDGVSVHSYINNGTYRAFRAGARDTLRLGSLKLSANAESISESYHGEACRHSVAAGGSLLWYFGKFFTYATVGWRNRDYTPVSITEYSNPLNAHVQLTWQPVKPLQLTLGLPYFWGVREDLTTTSRNEYSHIMKKRYTSASLRPWILISWTLRKNTKYAIDDRMPSY